MTNLLDAIDRSTQDEGDPGQEEEVLQAPISKPKKYSPNAEQQSAIEADVDSAVRILAPPGSGKTFVISYRYAYLIEHGIDPENILAVTFTKDMSTELLDRIAGVSPAVIGTAAERQVCTIHAICFRLLKSTGDRRNVAKEWQAKKAIQEIAEVVWRSPHDRPGWKEILHWVNMVKYYGLTSEEDSDFFIEGLGANDGIALHEVRRRFDAEMRKQNLLTFPDMLFDLEQVLITNQNQRELWQSKFTHVIVDEGQDTSAQAMRILTTLAKPQNNFFIVGDTDQLLYRFAGATPEGNLFEGFEEKYPDGKLVLLTKNYRSTVNVIDSCRTLIGNNYDGNGGPYEEKYMKEIEPRESAEAGAKVSFEMFNDPESEARSVADTIIEEMANGREPKDFFIGTRTRAQLGYLEGHLVRANIPFVNITGGSFWTLKHIADVVAYLALAHDNEDHQAFKRVYNIASKWFTHPWGQYEGEYCNHRYLGKAFMQACYGKFSFVWKAVNERRSFKPGVEDLTSFVGEIQMVLRESDGALGVENAIRFILENCYTAYLQADEGITSGDEAENGKLQDFETVVDVAAQFDTLAEFISYVKDAVKAANDAKNKNWDEYVVISTVHRLKGLERPVVIGTGWCEGQVMTADGPQPAGLLPHTFSLIDPPQFGRLPTGGKGRIEDERCIAYVLVSRAKERCYLSGCQIYRKAEMRPSRFLVEMGVVK